MRRSQISCNSRRCACCMRWITCSRGVPRVNLIGLRQQRALARHLLDVAGEDVGCPAGAHDLLGGQPSGKGDWCCTTLPSTMVRSTSRRLACLANWYSPDLSSSARLQRDHAADEGPADARRSRLPAPAGRRCRGCRGRGGMLTTLSAASGPGASNRCLPTANATPPTIATRISRVKMALPTITSGWRARFERAVGTRHLLGLAARHADCAA